MNDPYYSVAADNHERIVQAPDAGKALNWCLGNDATIAGAETIVITRRKDIVVVGGAKRGPYKKGEAATPAHSDTEAKAVAVPKGKVLVSTLATELNITIAGVQWRMKKLKIKGERLGDLPRKPTAVTTKDADRISSM